MKIQTNPKYKNLLSVSQEEYNILKQSIKEHGQLQPIIINSEGIILDGHLRYKACTELNIEPKFLIKQFDNILLEKQYVIKSNLSRRNLNNYQKAKLAYLLEPIEKELAKQRMLKGKPSDQLDIGSTRSKITKQVGIGEGTYERAKYVMEHGSKELQDDCELGKLSVNNACNILKESTKEYKENKLKQEHKEFLKEKNLIAEFECVDLVKIEDIISNAIKQLNKIHQDLLDKSFNLAANKFGEPIENLKVLLELIISIKEGKIDEIN